MPPDASSYAAVPPGIAAADIADGRETAAARPPSPCGADDPTGEAAMDHEVNHAPITSSDAHGIAEVKPPKRWVPARIKRDRKSGGGRLRLKSSGLFSSFTKAKGAAKLRLSNNHSSHPVYLSNLVEDEELPIQSNSVHNQCLTEFLRASITDGSSTADLERLLLDSHGENNDDDYNQNSASSLLESFGNSPTPDELANVAAVRAKEYIEECLRADVCVLDRGRWDAIPQYAKTDLLIGQHLGKGTFSDAFEVIATVVEEEEGTVPTLECFWEDGTELDVRIERAFSSRFEIGGGGDDDSFGCDEDLDAEIDALFGQPPAGLPSSDTTPKTEVLPAQRRRGRRQTVDNNGGAATAMGLRRSVCLGTHGRSQVRGGERRTTEVVMAMKCLRPQIRSDAEQFLIGVEDLVHETTMLASLDHPHIIKLKGRAGGCVGSSFRLSDGYFILLDRLKDTLEDRIVRWKKSHDKKASPSLCQIRTACAIADAMAYLHSKNIAFRDLKPANVGFDASGTLKLFDFGFATGIPEPRTRSSAYSDDDDDNSEESGLLYDKCGTPRYMAPEVGLQAGYGLPADVYSFGILLWEICSLKRPFGNVKSADEFHRVVFEKGGRPKLCRHWPPALTELMAACWLTDPAERPRMPHIRSILAAHTRELAAQEKEGGRDSNLRKSSVFRRFTG